MLLILLTTSPQLFAILTQCGQYNLNGVIRDSQTGPLLVVNEKTLSEYKISFNSNDSLKAAIYLDRHISAKIKITKLNNSYTLEDVELISIESRIPNPLNPQDTFIKLDKKLSCQ